MAEPSLSSRHRYLEWVEEQIEEQKASLTRDELLHLADEAVRHLFDSQDGQYPLTEMMLCDEVDALLFRQLRLPNFRQWLRVYHNDTSE